MNLAVYLVAKYGSPELASHCSKIFLVDSGRKVQTPYFVFTSPKKHGDEEIVKIQDWLETNFKKSVSIDTLAKVFNLGRRTLSRRFKMATGDTPLEYLQRLRIENAKRLLESSSHTFSEITWDVGYNDISSFQRLFSKATGLSPGAYRKKFSMIEA
jgi:transcriptional regulator GlxA family with amidase domain